MRLFRLIRKLVKSPQVFFSDVIQNKVPLSKKIDLENTIFAFHINDWKRPFFERMYSDKTLLYIPFSLQENVLRRKYLTFFKKNQPDVLVWGMNIPEYIRDSGANITYVEDGFIRSVGLGSEHTLPMSLCFDKQTAYFDSQKPSDLEELINNYDFSSDESLMQRAKELKSTLISTGISKYNHSSEVDVDKIYGKKTTKRVLVLGQVEDDASIKYGCIRPYTNNELVKTAVSENPDAQIIYKPHPDVLFQKRDNLSNPQEVADICQVLTQDIPLAQSLETIDHVYTITSQAGFEALLRGIKVTTLGCPFYSGWGLTDDRQLNSRREAVRTVDEVLAGAYILYPKYFDSDSGKLVEVEDVISMLIREKI